MKNFKVLLLAFLSVILTAGNVMAEQSELESEPFSDGELELSGKIFTFNLITYVFYKISNYYNNIEINSSKFSNLHIFPSSKHKIKHEKNIELFIFFYFD